MIIRFSRCGDRRSLVPHSFPAALVSIVLSLNAAAAGPIPREQLIQDARAFSDAIEDAHPDPYTQGGGKVAYHRRLQQLIRDIPAEGLTAPEFNTELQRFLARVGDGHTTMDGHGRGSDPENPGGVPLYFEVVEQSLWVAGVYDAEHVPLIGARMESVAGVPFQELVEREFRRRGHDNVHHALSSLSRRGALCFSESLAELVPEWGAGADIPVVLRHADGLLHRYSLPVLRGESLQLIRNASRVDIPGRSNWFGYHFPGTGKKTAYLWIDNMTTYREMFEYARSIGSDGWQGWARRVYERSRGEPAPDDMSAVIAGIASASAVFTALLQEMKDASTDTLVIDLRNNFGGNDLMVQIFLYHLVGFDRMVSIASRTAVIRKMSALLDSSSQSGVDPEQVHYHGEVPMLPGDYDFSLDARFMAAADLHAAAGENYQRMFMQMPTFAAVFQARQKEAMYRPRRILVLSGNATQSSGFDLLVQLDRLGAEVVGVTPSQAGNSFGDIREFKLKNSGLAGWVSTKYFQNFPNESPAGYAFQPHHVLTYAKLGEYAFDPQASLLLAMSIADSERHRSFGSE